MAGAPSCGAGHRSRGITVSVLLGAAVASCAAPERDRSYLGTVAHGEASTAAATGRATLSWLAPNRRIDGSCLAGLRGFEIRWGPAPDRLVNRERLSAAEAQCRPAGAGDECGARRHCTYTVESLPSGTWYFAVVARGAELASPPSETVRKTITTDGPVPVTEESP
jgi:hypothetical protein